MCTFLKKARKFSGRWFLKMEFNDLIRILLFQLACLDLLSRLPEAQLFSARNYIFRVEISLEAKYSAKRSFASKKNYIFI